MTIETLQILNDRARHQITQLKNQINELDQFIRANEREIGLQLEEMSQNSKCRAEVETDCTLCLGECDGKLYGGQK